MSPGIGLMDRRLKTEKDAISLATSVILKEYKTQLDNSKRFLDLQNIYLRIFVIFEEDSP